MRLLQSINHFDTSMFMGIMNNRYHARFARFGRIVSKTGDGHLYLLLAAYFYWIDSQLGSTLLASFLLAFGIERPLYLIIKNGFRRNRPAVALQNVTSHVIPSDQFSFPSGHTSAAFLIATLLGYSSPTLAPLLYGWATMVGFSRLVLGVHYPTDILVGMSMGTSIALISLGVMA